MTAKTKSPPAPSFSLEKAFEETQKIYDEFSRAQLTETDIASALGHKTANSGAFTRKRFTLCEYGLLEEGDETDGYTVATAFLDLRDHRQDKVRFRTTAFKLVANANVFEKLLEGLHDKVPNEEHLASRLEREGFTRDRALEVAETFRASLQFAEVLGNDGRLLRPGEDQPPSGEKEQQDQAGSTSDPLGRSVKPPAENLSLELASESGGKIVVSYPRDLSASDAQKVSDVLSALATKAS